MTGVQTCALPISAARVLGPRWRQISRSAGKVFAGTVLSVEMQLATKGRPIPSLEVKLRVDHGIAGVQTRQTITLREWAGAASTHRAMRGGQHVLLFLYPPSRLGLTSPVGGALGQIALDASGKNVARPIPIVAGNLHNSRFPGPARAAVSPQIVSVSQLERAIRSARKE